MKTTLLLMSLFCTLNAFAHPMLQYRKTNGSVAPAYRRTITCMIHNDRVVHNLTAPNIRTMPLTTNVIWSAEVPDLSNLQSLIDTAQESPSVRTGCIPPIGGGVTHYSMLIPGMGIPENPNSQYSEKTLSSITGNCEYEANPSAEGATLKEFIDLNCNKSASIRTTPGVSGNN